MVVSVALFAIVVTVSTGALLQVLATNRQAQAVETVMNNLDFALQQMSRDIRVGTNYYCGTNFTGARLSCADGGSSSSFSYTAHDGTRVVYELDGDQIKRSNDGGTNYYSITSPEIHLTNDSAHGGNGLKFYVTAGEAGNVQPKVRIVIDGHVQIKNAATYFELQTTVSSRTLNRG